jgi:hypothetical protein
MPLAVLALGAEGVALRLIAAVEVDVLEAELAGDGQMISRTVSRLAAGAGGEVVKVVVRHAGPACAEQQRLTAKLRRTRRRTPSVGLSTP